MNPDSIGGIHSGSIRYKVQPQHFEGMQYSSHSKHINLLNLICFFFIFITCYNAIVFIKKHQEETMKAFFCILVFIPLISLAQTIPAREKAFQHRSINTVVADSIPPDTTGMGSLTSVELSRELIPGWNVGNSLDATGGEISWGNPMITQQLIDSIYAAGFRSVRIPVAWSYLMDTSTYTINAERMARVEEVIGYVLYNGMYAIINEHWDGGWMQPTYAQQAYVNNRLRIMWEQIATYFRDYDSHLLFAGMNEVMVNGNYGSPTVEYRTVHNSFCQTFVNAVRSTGGCNVYRYLLVQGFNTNIDYTYNYFVIPTDPTEYRLFIEVHYYDPYNFTLNTGSSITQWGMYATDPLKTETWANESYADNQFQKMKTKYINNGYGVVLGEYGAMSRTNLGSPALNEEYARYRRYYMKYITRSLERHGLVPIYWDAGGTGNFSSGIFYRSTGGKAYPDIINAMVDTNNVYLGVGEVDYPSRPVNYSLMQNFPNPFNPLTTISFDIPSRTFVSLKIFDLLGKEIASIVSEEMSTGTYSRQWNATNMPSGIYFYQLRAGSYTETKKLVLLR
jgi:endoglucanase